MSFRETQLWRRGRKWLLLALLLLLAKMWDDLAWEYHMYMSNVPYRPVCRPPTEEIIHGDAPKRRYLDGALHPRFRALLLENVRKLYSIPRYQAPYLVVGGRIMVSENEAEGWGGGGAEAQWRAIEELAKAWYFPPGEVRKGIPDHIRVLVESLSDERGFVDMRDCRLVKVVVIDGW